MAGRDEFDLIARYFAPLAEAAPGAFNLTDDAARLDIPEDHDLVVTSDALVAGVHFLADQSPGDIARKVLRVNLSDLAAMGARPVGYLLAACLPQETDESWIAAFAEALKADQEIYGVALIGGDTVATSGPLSLTVTAHGAVPKGGLLRRNGAKEGDGVYVSGTIGDGALGLLAARGKLASLSNQDHAYLLDRYLCPRPRLRLGQALLGNATAALDLSDGLLADLGHLADESGLGARITQSRVPLSDAVRAAQQAEAGLVDLPMTGGDDYELCFTMPLEREGEIATVSQESGVPLTRIGTMMAGKGVTVIDEQGKERSIKQQGYRHF
ncbi:thiamine-phosphate kinase [Magnetospira sp. QH-2]|uniref:thiamine-phosphate kinase n=1 Tax=Magnetospira sp. (strain QH-2) TaxID=1288970 RepID=UPI0003E81AED|nr:thiamine-phosphate kinase [Magnetospira sp. QH-2]CCQ73825.1 thiamin-monophosphate kinase [Magnetospira sp. QH-2]